MAGNSKVTRSKYSPKIQAIIDEVKEDQKKALTSNDTPLTIANRIKNLENQICYLKDCIEQMEEEN